MIRILKYTVFILVLLLGKIVHAQSDTIISSTAQPDSIDVKYDRIYKLFVQEQDHDIQHLIKLNLFNIDVLMPKLAFEQKLGRSLSCEANIFVAYIPFVFSDDSTTKFHSTLEFRDSDFQCFSIGGYQMLKIFHNLKRRERLGRNTNGFSGNYFGIKVSENYTWFGANEQNNYLENKYYLIPGFQYGIQRRIGNIGNTELCFSLNYPLAEGVLINDESWKFGLETAITFKIGFAIESVSSLKKMLK
ncbi:MAG: hypothetical protein JXA77_10665 [Bacteroidales bacterium]|nr:hypothetical protein [Bacteroidales bacterium]MBN2820537.1 hypothetical protein [Bacteroidales bacterium]